MGSEASSDHADGEKHLGGFELSRGVTETPPDSD